VRTRIIDFVPATYHRFLPAFFDAPVQEERHATCSDCAMCAPAGVTPDSGTYFAPSTKCCTYHPALPNYAVGGLLLDESDDGREGRRRIAEKITHRVGVTPFGIQAPPRVRFLMDHGKAGFGRATSLVCPFLDQEQRACTVWAHREAECATWFCKHNNGLDGRIFWSALRDYLSEIQRVLSFHALRELGYGAAQILGGTPSPSELDAWQMDDRPPPDGQYRAMWKHWMDREADLYASAYQIVSDLDRPAFERIAGLRHDLLVDALAMAHRAITSPTLPDPLIKNPALRVDRTLDDGYVVTMYSTFDPTRLRKSVFELLDHFDGKRPTAAVRAAIQAQTGLSVSDSFLTRLYQHRILIDPAWGS
jgi:Fe-S-cluster containining protein